MGIPFHQTLNMQPGRLRAGMGPLWAPITASRLHGFDGIIQFN
jgi:hypothetical protein